MFTIHTVAGPVRSPADLAGADPVLKELLFHHLVERGIFLAARGFVAMSLAINDDDCDRFVDALADSVTTIEAACDMSSGSGTAAFSARVAHELVAELELGRAPHVGTHLRPAHRPRVQHHLQPESVEQRAQPPRGGDRVVGLEGARLHASGDDLGEDVDPAVVELLGDATDLGIAQRLAPHVDPERPALVVARRREVGVDHVLELCRRILARRRSPASPRSSSSAAVSRNIASSSSCFVAKW